MRRIVCKADGDILWDSAYPSSDTPILNFKAKFEVNKTYSASFTILPGHRLYDSLKQMKTIISIEMNGRLIFRGRVIEMVTDLFKQRNVSCESDIAFLMDSVIFAGDIIKKHNTSPRELLRTLLAMHNQVTEDYKHIELGEVSIEEADETKDFDIDGYSKTSELLSSQFLQEYGGIMRTRTENGVTYLDYVEDPFTAPSETVNSQPIQFGVNLVDLSNQTYPVSDLFTVLIPLGKDNLDIKSVNGDSKYLVSEEAADKYGLIYKTEQWSDIDTPGKLKLAGLKYLQGNARAFPNNMTIRAVDLVILDSSAEEFKMGDNILVSIPHLGIEEVLYCLSAEYDFQNPGGDTFTIGSFIPTDKIKGSTSEKSGGGGGGGGGDEPASKQNASHGRSAGKAKAGVSGLQNEVEAVEEKITEWSQKIQDDEGNIAELQILSNQIKGEVRDNAGNISTLRQTATEIDAAVKKQNGDITELKVSTGSITARVDSHDGYFTEIRETVDGINTTVSQIDGDVSELKITANGLVSTVSDHSGSISALNQRANSIELSVKGKLDESSVTITDDSISVGTKTFRVDATTIVNKLASRDVVLGNITASNLTLGGTTYTSHLIGFTSASASGYFLGTSDLSLHHSHSFSFNVSGGTVTATIGGESDSNGSDFFNIADTQFYRDGVSAAASGVTLTGEGWSRNGVYTVSATNGRSFSVNLPQFSSTGGTYWNSNHQTIISILAEDVGEPVLDVTVDADSVYADGHTEGVNDVKNGLRLNSSGWNSRGENTIEVRYNGVQLASEDISLPSIILNTGWWNRGSRDITVTADGVGEVASATIGIPTINISVTVDGPSGAHGTYSVTATCGGETTTATGNWYS